MFVDHPLCEGLDIKTRGVVESHATELYLGHVLDRDVTHEVAVALHVRTGPAGADGARASPGPFRRGRLRTFGVRTAGDDNAEGSHRKPRPSCASHRILPSMGR